MPGLHELIDNLFGVRSRAAENREATAITTTSQLIARNDSTRLAMTVVNLGAQSVLVRNRDAPTATVGFLLGPNGANMVVLFNEDFTMVGHDWFAITPSGTSTIYVEEILVEPDA